MNEINAILSRILVLQEELIVAKHRTYGLQEADYHRVVSLARSLAEECTTLPYQHAEPVRVVIEPTTEAIEAALPPTEKIEEPQQEEKKASGTDEAPIRKISLNINDRFMFRRELFNNDDNAMKSLLHEIERLDTLEEATILLGNRLGRDRDDETIQLLISGIEKHFK